MFLYAHASQDRILTFHWQNGHHLGASGLVQSWWSAQTDKRPCSSGERRGYCQTDVLTSDDLPCVLPAAAYLSAFLLPAFFPFSLPPCSICIPALPRAQSLMDTGVLKPITTKNWMTEETLVVSKHQSKTHKFKVVLMHLTRLTCAELSSIPLNAS